MISLITPGDLPSYTHVVGIEYNCQKIMLYIIDGAGQYNFLIIIYYYNVIVALYTV